MPPKKNVPADAWDDDWESLADVRMALLHTTAFAHMQQKEDEKPEEQQPEPKLTKAQLKARHIELNRQIWESAYVSCSTPPAQH